MTEAVASDAAHWQTLDSQRPGGERPWDDWRKRAIGMGVSEELAALGRAVMREAELSGWSEESRIVCGWLDDGQAMIALALRQPLRAERAWSRLLETQGAPTAKPARR